MHEHQPPGRCVLCEGAVQNKSRLAAPNNRQTIVHVRPFVFGLHWCFLNWDFLGLGGQLVALCWAMVLLILDDLTVN